jgi:uncharacterized protein (DUF2384 family)
MRYVIGGEVVSEHEGSRVAAATIPAAGHMRRKGGQRLYFLISDVGDRVARVAAIDVSRLARHDSPAPERGTRSAVGARNASR